MLVFIKISTKVCITLYNEDIQIKGGFLIFYLLWEASVSDYFSESFVLFETNASEALAENFIKDYFKDFKILQVSNDVVRFSEVIDKQCFAEEEINAWYQEKHEKEAQQRKYDVGKWAYLTPWREKVEASKEKLKLNKNTEQEVQEHFSIYKKALEDYDATHDRTCFEPMITYRPHNYWEQYV